MVRLVHVDEHRGFVQEFRWFTVFVNAIRGKALVVEPRGPVLNQS